MNEKYSKRTIKLSSMQLFYITFGFLLTFTSCNSSEDYPEPDIQSLTLNVENDSLNNIFDKSTTLIEAIDTTIMCVQGLHETELIIRSQIEYDKVLEVRSPHPDCKDYNLPPIDFNKYILIGIRRSAAGNYVTSNKKITFQEGIFFITYHITQHGRVERLNHIREYFLIEKNGDQNQVEFIFTKRYEEN